MTTLDAPLRVGVIGASSRGWGVHAHLPALAGLPQYRVTALSATRLENAQRTAALFGVPHAFADNRELVTHPEVDVVAITVKVPHHYELAVAAIEAGKHVYCEWPLAMNVAAAQELAALARSRGVRAAVGLQGRSSPGINQLRALLAEGYVGEVLSASLIISAEHYLDSIPEELEALLYPQYGTHLLTVHFAHLADCFCWCLGEFAELSASFATRRREVTIIERGERVQALAADHIAVSGTLVNGATATIHLRGGHSRATGLSWEINGTQGDLLVSAAHGNIHIVPLELQGGRGEQTGLTPMPIGTAHRWAAMGIQDGPPFNVAQAYARFARDVREGTRTCPDFDDGVLRHRLLAAVEGSARTGTRQKYL